MSCVICQDQMSELDYPDHVRVYHPEDERELLGLIAPSMPFVAVA